jgi:hypothetical protein
MFIRIIIPMPWISFKRNCSICMVDWVEWKHGTFCNHSDYYWPETLFTELYSLECCVWCLITSVLTSITVTVININSVMKHHVSIWSLDHFIVLKYYISVSPTRDLPG